MPGLFDRLKKRADTPIEHRNYGGVYLLLSGLLFVGTMWSVVDEISTRRPWKEYQETYLSMSEEGWKTRVSDERAYIDSTELLELYGARDSLDGVLRSPELVSAARSVDEIDHRLLDANRAVTFAKSKGDEAYYFWKKSVHEGEEDEGLRDETLRLGEELETAKKVVDSLTTIREGFAGVIEDVRSAQKEVNRRIAALLKDASEAERKLEIASNASIQIKQVMMNGFDRSNFGIPKPRIDRCQTCHMGWKDEMMSEAPQPFTPHPLPALLKTHDPEVFGCTPCHHGQGAALTAGLAHGDEDHYWEWPLLRGDEVYSSCNSCHEHEVYLKDGGRFNKGKQILLESGCYGCHEIKGFANLPKIGPDLKNLSSKLDPQWLFRWIRNPKEYNPHTRMPDFRLNDAQSEAVAAFVMNAGTGDGSREGRKSSGTVSRGGDPASGKELVETIGCKGCHVIGDDDRMRVARGFSFDIAPELTRAGSKLDPDWLFRWIKNPREYRPTTPMPNLRLSDREARDIVAYIMTLKDDREFEDAPLDLSSEEKQREGFRVAREYGCAGCHNIPGLEKENKVSVSLSNLGRKRIDEIDFGDTKVPHTWDDWFFGKIKNSRQYATERILSKMPVFALADSEIVMLRTVMKGMTKDVPEPEYRRPYDKILQNVEAGRRLADHYNCINCHKIEEIGGAISAVVEGEGKSPPFLLPEGSKVQEEWLHGFLKNPTTIRPWLSIRMPTFQLTDAEITAISAYFLGLHKQTLGLRDYSSYTPDPKYVSVGKSLFDDLQCLSCHYTGVIPEGKGPEDLAPNLAMAKTRLKPEWVDQWIARPDSIAPGTRMPNYFPDLVEPSPYSDALDSDVRAQIRALREYIFFIH